MLERRELLSTFPLTGTFTGNYDTRAAQDGIGQGQEVSGTITVSITVNTIQDEGGGIDQADVTGTVTVTGFLQPTATYPFSGENGLETGYGSSDPQSTVEVNIQAFNAGSPLNFVSIEGSGLTNSIYASCNIGLNNYSTPNAATVTLNGGSSPTGPPPTPTPTPVTSTGASLVTPKKGASQIVVAFQGPLGGGSGLPVSDFRLTTVPKGKKHAKVIPLASASFNGATDTVTLTPRGKRKLKAPLELTISGLPGGTSTLILDKRGSTIAARSTDMDRVSGPPVDSRSPK